MWKDDKGRFLVSGLEDPVSVMSDAFRRCLDVLIDHDAEAVARAVEEASSQWVAAEAALTADPLVEAKFKGLRPPTPLLSRQVASVDELRDLILQVDRRWQMDASVALDDYLESEVAARQLGARCEDSKPDGELVDVSTSSVERAWKDSGFNDFWLLLRTEQTDLGVLASAASEADQVAERDGIEPRSIGLTPCPGGFAVELGQALEPQPISDWIRHFVAALERHGVAGRLGGAAQAWIPRAVRDGPPVPTLWARFRLPPTAASDRPGWEVEESQTRRVVQTTLDWALADPGSIILTQAGFSLRVEHIDLQQPLERALLVASSGDVDVFDEAAGLARHAALGLRADAIFQVIGRSRQDTVTELRDLATRLPPPLDYAFVRVANRCVLGIFELDTVQKLPGIKERHVRYNPHLLDRYLPDAHGVQIVTDAHLRAARDLSGWTITDLGQGRHLVAAADLEPWYRDTLPDPDTLAHARADWHGALLTEDVIAAFGVR